jgi:SPP1 gp7 family putative phage head morphogenesis protein
LADLHHLLATPLQRRWIEVHRRQTAQALRAGARRAHGQQYPRAAEMRYVARLREVGAKIWRVAIEATAPEFAGKRRDLGEPRPTPPTGVVGEAKIHLYKVVDEARGVVWNSAQDVNGRNVAEMRRLIGVNPKLDTRSQDTLDQYARKNVQLIRNLADDALARIEKTIQENRGLRHEEIADLLDDQEDVVGNRAALIARDQVSKLNANLTRVRCEECGIDEYIWTTSGDERVRDTHRANDEKRFRFDSPPPETGNPGEDVNCRCTQFPVVAGLEDL